MKNLLVSLLLLLFAGGAYWYWKVPKYGDGELAPDFTATKPDGSSLTLSEFKGQYVLLDFWGSWCPPCRKENPALVKLYDKYKASAFKDAKAFTIVSVAIETNPKAWQAAIARDGLSWPNHVSAVARFKDPVAQLYGVREIPTKYLIGPAGNVISVNQSVAEIDAFLQEKMK